MDEIEELPVEALDGERPASSAGDRLMVGLAALVLVSGLLIAGTNLLGALNPDAVADTSPTPTADSSHTPRPSPTPRPLQELTLVPDELPSPQPQPINTVQGWLEAVAEVAVVSAPTSGAPELARLSPGTVIMAYEDWASRGNDGWLQTATPIDAGIGSVFGWIQARAPDGSALANFYPMDDRLRSGEVWSIRADRDGFVALIVPPGRRNYSMIEPQLAISVDGESWQLTGLDPTLLQGGWTAARGPSGWLGVSMIQAESSPRPWIWESYDGKDWSPLGYLPMEDQAWFTQLIGSDFGYVLVRGGGGAGSPLWFSPDGVTWQESADPFAAAGRDVRFLGSDPIGVLALDTGFVAWTGSYDGAPYPSQVAFSSDGRTWSSVPVDGAEVGRLQLADAGGALIATATLPDGSTGVWRSVNVGGRISRMERAPSLDRGLLGASIDNLLSAGDRAWALGYEHASGSPRLWWTDGGAWHAQPLPARLQVGSSPLAGAARKNDLVVLGARPTSAGDNPIFWHLRASGEWVAEPNPIVPLVPDPSGEECASLPATAVAFAILDPAVAVACHGDAPMTFAAWSGTCCSDPGSGPVTGPDWLTRSVRTLLLSPVQAQDDWFAEAVVHPSLEQQPSWANAWLRVTGHYADPAAEDCAWDSTSGEAGYYHAVGSLAIEFCRQRFVVTAVTVVEGPPTAGQ